jgi:beta-galactosidase GanA
VVRRDDATTSLLYVLNYRPAAVEIDLDEPADELLSGRRLSGACTLEPYGVAILRRAGV